MKLDADGNVVRDADGNVVEEEVTGTVEEAMANMRARANSYQGAVDGLWSAVTSVSLYYTAEWTNGAGTYLGGVFTTPDLVFVEGEEKENVFPADPAVATKQYTFTEGKMVTQVDSLVIRVSPVNAALDIDQISLINTQGEIVDKELVSVIDVHPFVTDEPLTRANSETGLWTVVFKLKDGYDTDAFATTARYRTRNILFAVGVNNTLDDAAERMAVSEYDVTLNTGDFTEAYSFDVNDIAVEQIHNRWVVAEDPTAVTNDPVNFPNTYAIEMNWLDPTTDHPTPWTIADDNNSVNRDNVTPITRLRDYPQFALYDYDDNRNVKPILSLAEEKVGDETIYQSIKIAYPKAVRVGGVNYYMPLRGFYVTLDQDFAVESKPSEINAWRSYEYENVGYKKADGTYVKATMFDGNEGTIAVKNLNGVKGDIIGFRVYAVNIDGTLVDPDGRAFYVRLGEVIEKKALSLDVLTLNANAANDELNEDNYFNTEIIDVEEGFFQDDLAWTQAGVVNQEWLENNPYVYLPAAPAVFGTPEAETANAYARADNGNLVSYWNATTNIVNLTTTAAASAGAFFNVVFWDSKTNAWTATPSASTTKVKGSINIANRVLDGATYSFKILGYNEVNRAGTLLYRELLQDITINIKKVMPTDLSGLLSVKTGQLGETNNEPVSPLRVFMKPVTNNGTLSWTNFATAERGEDILPFDLSDIFNGLQTPLKSNVDHTAFRFTFKDSDWDAVNEKAIDNESVWGSWNSGASNAWDRSASANYLPIANKSSYFVPNAYKTFVNDKANEEEKLVDVSYDYQNISLVADANGAPKQDIYPLTKENYFKVIYRCALRSEFIHRANEGTTAEKNNFAPNTFSLTNNQYQIAYLNGVNQLNFKDNGGNDITFGQQLNTSGVASAVTTSAQAQTQINNMFEKIAYEGNGYDFDLSGTYPLGQWKIDLDVFFYNYNAEPYGTTNLGYAAYLNHAGLPNTTPNVWQGLSLKNLINAGYLTIDPNSISFKDDRGHSDYYKVTDYTAGIITLTNTRANERPSLPDRVKHTLSFDVEDAFGHKTTIKATCYMLKPVTITTAREK